MAGLALDISLGLDISEIVDRGGVPIAIRAGLPPWSVSEMPKAVADAEARLLRLRQASRILKEEISRPVGKTADIDSLFDRFALGK